jgi:hypothetical protein
MPERKPVFLNGAPFWSPLLVSIMLLSASVTTHYLGGSLPVALQCLGGILFIANLGTLMSCRSAFGRWLGRTKYPEISVMLSGALSFANVIILPHPETDITSVCFALVLFTSVLISLGVFALGILCFNSYHIEDSEGNVVAVRDCSPPGKVRDITQVWNDLVQKKSIRSGDRLMQRKLFGSSQVCAAEGLEWLAWRSEDIGNENKAILVFGRDIASARQSAAQQMSADPDLIVVAPRVMYGACATRLDEAAKHQERRKQEEKAEVAALQAQICPENSPLMLEEDHLTRMDRLFYEAIDAPYSFASKN